MPASLFYDEQIFNLPYCAYFWWHRCIRLCAFSLLGLVLCLFIWLDLGGKNTAKIHRTFICFFMGLEFLYIWGELATCQYSSIWRCAFSGELFIGGVVGGILIAISTLICIFGTPFTGAASRHVSGTVDVYRIPARLGFHRLSLVAIRLYAN